MGDVTPLFKEAQGIDLAAERRRWKAERPDVLRRSPWCLAGNVLEAHLPSHRCGRRCTEIHHRRRTSRGGQYRLPANHLPVCKPCHGAIHANVELARSLTLLVHEGDPEWNLLGYAPTPSCPTPSCPSCGGTGPTCSHDWTEFWADGR